MLRLFDSVYHGYPIGSLLIWQRPAPAERVSLGHLVIDAPESSHAWSVVDGQQRLTALAASLVPGTRESDDRFALFFDPVEKKFTEPPTKGSPPERWVPVFTLLDATTLSEMMSEPPYSALDKTARKAVFEAGKRIREYTVPLYVIESDDEQVLRDIFFRINDSGVPLNWTEVHAALFGSDRRQPSTTADVADELAKLGMGRPDDAHLLSAIVAAAGLDPTRSVAEHIDHRRDEVGRAVSIATPALRHALSFLRTRCGVPHIRLLPHWEAVSVLGRFFAVHSDPQPRTLELLIRWVWRGPLIGDYEMDARTMLRRALSSITEDEYTSTQNLLRLLQDDLPRQHLPLGRKAFSPPSRFDARTAASRVALLGLSYLEPRRISDGKPMDVGQVIDEHDLEAFPQMLTKHDGTKRSSAANRLIHPPEARLHHELKGRAVANVDDPVLVSHCIDKNAAQALAADDVEAFFEAREGRLAAVIEEMRRRYGGWGRGDRPSIDYLLRQHGRD